MAGQIEVWKDIKGYKGLYQVSNLGRIKSLPKPMTNGKGNYYRKERILKPIIQNTGYLTVTLYKNKKDDIYYIHRLVAETFLKNPDNLPVINHKDENKTNNCVDNLEWCTDEYNLNYGTRNKSISKAMINNPLQSKCVLCIETGIIYPSMQEVERLLKIHNSHICDCCKGRRKTAGGYHWEYVEEGD